MNLKGKYTIIRKNKSGNILQKKSKYNKITTKGRNIVLNLFKNATSDGDFKQLIGYKPLDLSSYKLTPLLRNTSYNKEDSNSKEYVKSVLYKGTLTGDYADYQTNFQFENESQQKWNVKSSFFFQNFVQHDGKTYKYSVDNWNKTASVTDSYYREGYGIQYDYNESRRSNVDYSQYDYQLTNNGNNSKSSIDQILFYNNQIDFTWSGCDTSYSSFLTRNIHNIDFFLVRCKQKIISRKKDLQIPLWNGMSSQLYESNVVLTQSKVKFRHSFSHWDDTKKECYQKPNIIVLHRKSNSDNSSQWQELADSNFVIDESKMTIKFTSNNFSNGTDYADVDQFVVLYNVYYLDDQLKNGICGMYLNYQLIHDQQEKNLEQISSRMKFGNGVFSYDGFKTLDDRLSFPWQGRPVKIQKTYQNSDLDYKQRFYDNLFNGKLAQHSPTHKLNITSQYIDYVPQRFYSFYPYVTNSPTNFVFMLTLYNNKIKIRNFVFLVPQLRTTTPRVFVFGSQQTQSTNEQQITKEIFRLDAIQCDSESTKNVDDEQVSLITWKTYIDYQVGNNQLIKQLGLACGKDKLEETAYGWRYIKPITKDQCNQLFSKITLQEAVSKTDEQALEVIYELVVQ